MKVIAVNGITKSGKTTVCEIVISGLRERGYSVGSVKEIHFEEFKIDPVETTNTNRHKKAGSQLVTARGMFETDILYQSMIPMEEILKHYDHDYVILEGVTDINVPKIITAHNIKEVEERMDHKAFLVSGVLANEGHKEVCGLEVIHAIEDSKRLVDKVEEMAMEPMPSFDPDCCMECGYTCEELTRKIIDGESTEEDCVIKNQDVTLNIDGTDISMVPFVQNILKNAVMGVVKELDGSRNTGEITVKFKL